MEIHTGQEEDWRAGSKEKTPASRYKEDKKKKKKEKGCPTAITESGSERRHEGPGEAKDEEGTSGPNSPQNMRSKEEESDEDSCSVDGLCRCPVWCGQAPEAGDFCPDCFQVRAQPRKLTASGPLKQKPRSKNAILVRVTPSTNQTPPMYRKTSGEAAGTG